MALADYNNAKGRVDASVARQALLTTQQAQTEAKLKDLEARVGSVADAAYRGRRMNMAIAILDSSSPDGMLHAATTVQYLVDRDDHDLRDLHATRKQLADEQTQLANELKLQQQQLSIMDAKRKDADAALRKAGGGQPVSGGPTGGKATANAAPRNPDGSFASQSATIKDPTGTGGHDHAAPAQRLQRGPQGGLHALHEVLAQPEQRRAPEGPGVRLLGQRDDVRRRPRDRLRQDLRRQPGRLVHRQRQPPRRALRHLVQADLAPRPAAGQATAATGRPAGDHYNHVHLSVQ